MTDEPFNVLAQSRPGMLMLHPQYIEVMEQQTTAAQKRLDSAIAEAPKDKRRKRRRFNEASSPSPDDGFWEGWIAQIFRPYNVVDGVLIIPVKGVLAHNNSYQIGSWVTGYEYISRAVMRGEEDGNVERIVFDVSSPGGTVAGCFTCAAEISSATKPTTAVANEWIFSAAYALAAACDEIVMCRTGEVGSVGVLGTHIDYSAMLERIGVDHTFIHAGERKLDMRPEMPLSDEARAAMQDRVDDTYSVFVAQVAEGRGMSEDAVRETEAGTFGAIEAIELGLADRIDTLSGTLLGFTNPVAEELPENPTMEDDDMSTKPTTVTQADHDAAVTTARTEGTAAGATAERERISGILSSPKGQEHPAQAQHVAFNTDWDLNASTAFLTTLPAAAAAPAPAATTPAPAPAATTPAPVAPTAATSAFEQAMETSPGPQVGAETVAPGTDASGAPLSAEAQTDAIFAAAGHKPRAA